MMLATQINVTYYQTLMAGIRNAIEHSTFSGFCAETIDGWTKGDMPER